MDWVWKKWQSESTQSWHGRQLYSMHTYNLNLNLNAAIWHCSFFDSLIVSYTPIRSGRKIKHRKAWHRYSVSKQMPYHFSCFQRLELRKSQPCIVVKCIFNGCRQEKWPRQLSIETHRKELFLTFFGLLRLVFKHMYVEREWERRRKWWFFSLVFCYSPFLLSVCVHAQHTLIFFMRCCFKLYVFKPLKFIILGMDLREGEKRQWNIVGKPHQMVCRSKKIAMTWSGCCHCSTF